MPRLKAEVVTSHRDMATGLMGRKHLPKDAGMLFDFGSDQPLSFWMKNTYLPLQIAFIDSAGVVRHIASMAPLSTRSVRSPTDCRYALEVNEGWFDHHNVRVGATVAIPKADPGQDSQQGGKPEDDGKEQAAKPAPTVVIEQSFKDILSAASDVGLPVVVEYVTKDGTPLPPKAISPPFEFGDTAEGDPKGLLTVWDDQRGRYTSLIVDNITGVKDSQGNPIPNAARVQELARGTPNRMVDDMSAKGKIGQPVE